VTTILALDLATVTGWALGAVGSDPTFGHMRFAKRGEPHAKAYRELRLWLDKMLAWNKAVNLIVYESPAVPSFMGGKTNIDTTRLLFGLAENLEEFCHDRVELREASVSQVRAHFIGQNLKSKIAKPMTMEKCRDLGWMCTSTDESDACALWSYQCGLLDPMTSLQVSPLFRRKLV
jgi:hypothetical protein